MFPSPGCVDRTPELTYTGKLVDSSGNPEAGPVDLELRIFTAEISGTRLYTEDHLNTALDVTGAFSVQLGMGTNRTAGRPDARTHTT